MSQSNEFIQRILDALHGATVEQAFEALREARKIVDKQSLSARVDKDADIKADIAAFSRQSEVK